MMDIPRLLLVFGLRTRVLHRLPGRIRIEVLALRKIPTQHREISTRLLEAIPFPEGVTSFHPSLITGNVLIEYDPSVIDEALLLAHLRGVADLVLRYRDKVMQLTPAQMPQVMIRLTEFLKNGNSHPRASLKEVAIPDDVWT